MTCLEEYFSAVVDGTVTACEKLRKQADRLLEAYANPDEFHFDYEMARPHIE